MAAELRVGPEGQWDGEDRQGGPEEEEEGRQQRRVGPGGDQVLRLAVGPVVRSLWSRRWAWEQGFN